MLMLTRAGATMTISRVVEPAIQPPVRDLGKRQRRSVTHFLSLLVWMVITPVLAKEVDEPPASSVGRDPDMASINREVEIFGHAVVSAEEAILAAEQHIGGGDVIDIGFAGDAGPPFYLVRAYRGETAWDLMIDAATRGVKTRAVAKLGLVQEAEEREQVKIFKRLDFRLSDAVVVAEKHAFGRAISAGLDRVDGRLVILVVVVSEGRLKQVSIDPRNNAGTRTPRMKAKAPSREKQP
jgi:uncharacterized membrane protein YkoI